MILRRIGNKAALAKYIVPYFPYHKIYIELFFGAGGLFFNKPRAQYNFLNDFDSDIYNLFMILLNRRQELLELVKIMPVHQDLWDHWKKEQETDALRKALRFLFLSNFGYMGMPNTMHFAVSNDKAILLDNLAILQNKLLNCKFLNCDFRDVIKKIVFRDDKKYSFIYADPPYLNTKNNYSHGFSEKDSEDLFNVLENSGIKWAMSELDNPFIIEQAKKRKLNIYFIIERKSLKNRCTEILITNYKKINNLFDQN